MCQGFKIQDIEQTMGGGGRDTDQRHKSVNKVNSKFQSEKSVWILNPMAQQQTILMYTNFRNYKESSLL